MDRGKLSAGSGLCKIGLLIGLLGWPAPLRSGSPKTVGESPSGARLLSVRLLPEEVRLRGKGAAQQAPGDRDLCRRAGAGPDREEPFLQCRSRFGRDR